MKKLKDIAKIIRSKNAGSFRLTFDIIFPDEFIYKKVKKSKVISKELFCKLYNISRDKITDFVEYDPGYAIKVTIIRSLSSGDVGDSDIYGCQQYAPLLEVEVKI